MDGHQHAVSRGRSTTRTGPRPGVALAGLLATAVLGVGLFAGCGSDEGSAEPTTSTSSSIAAEVPALVGTWTRTTTCEEFVERQTEAGFTDDIVGNVVGNGWLPGIDSPEAVADPSQPCATAVPREHSHFFTEDGQFGSLDWMGEQVDEGTYELVDDETMVMPYVFDDDTIEITFHFRIDGDSIMFEPKPPADCTSAHCREASSWAVAVAYAGLSWQRTG